MFEESGLWLSIIIILVIVVLLIIFLMRKRKPPEPKFEEIPLEESKEIEDKPEATTLPPPPADLNENE